MNKIHKKLAIYAKKENVDLNQWKENIPHFNKNYGHRYDAFASEYVVTKSKQKVCVYCLKPENWRKEK